MSIVRCERCPASVDTEADTECQVYIGNYKRLHATITLCEKCRYEMECEQEWMDSLAARAEYEAERNAAE